MPNSTIRDHFIAYGLLKPREPEELTRAMEVLPGPRLKLDSIGQAIAARRVALGRKGKVDPTIFLERW